MRRSDSGEFPGKFHWIIVDYSVVAQMVTSLVGDAERSTQNVTSIIVQRDSVEKGYRSAAGSILLTPGCKGKKHEFELLGPDEVRLVKCNH